MAFITCENISLAYENNVVLSDLSFSVHNGDYLCIVGENGSGKSTLIKALLSFKRPFCGSIRFGDGLRQNEIGYLPQQTGAQKDFPASVWEVVQSGCMNQSGISPFYSAPLRPFGTGESEKVRFVGTAPSILPGTFRRPAATGFTGAGAVRHP